MRLNELQKAVLRVGIVYEGAGKSLSLPALTSEVAQSTGESYSSEAASDAANHVSAFLSERAKQSPERSEHRVALSNILSMRESTPAKKVQDPKPNIEQAQVTLQTFDASGREVPYTSPDAMRHRATLHLGNYSLSEAEAPIPFNYRLDPNLREAKGGAEIRGDYSFEVDRTKFYRSLRELEEAHGKGKVNAYAVGVAEKLLRSEGKTLAAFYNKDGSVSYDIQVEPFNAKKDDYSVRVVHTYDWGVNAGWGGYFLNVIPAFPSNSENS